MAKYKNPLIVGVTGGLGSGQSTVARLMEKGRAKVISADEMAKQAIARNKSLQKDLMKVFGDDIFEDGKLNRALLAERAFKDITETRKLNQVVHPRMVENIIDAMEKARFSGRYPLIVIDAALIYEISIERNFDAIIVVTATTANREKRVKERDGMTRAQFRERDSKQIPLKEKAAWADFVIENNGTLEELEEKARQVYKKLMEMQKVKERRGKLA
ncbi:MAG TPA: dephospho-CoA kinase [Caldithrix abyssi]|uniref:Dephospho-CoA kinase n=1 Tax=Caldithrix abyssi TaxID=187145 RepID=A0A7V5RQN3_CALAY|nr:dephospho-CoA kinase [Caldithrix abyssi]